MKKIIAVFLIMILTVCMAGCEGKPGSTDANGAKRKAPLKNGINAHIFELRPVMDPSSTMDRVADMTGVMGFNCYRLSTPLDSMFEVAEGDVPVFKEGQRALIHQVIEKMKAAGVKEFVAVSDAPIYPYGYQVTSSGVVPDPLVEKEMYLRWVKLYAKAWGMIVAEYPEITYIETMNEPDHPNANIFTKQGHQWGIDDGYVYSMTDKAHMIADIQYYVYKEAKAANPNVYVTTPGLCCTSAEDISLDYVYEAIESGAHPYGEDFADTDPDHYFDYINFHCYLGDATTEDYFNRCKSFYAAAGRHNDDGKPALLTEWGFTDRDNEGQEVINGENMTKLLEFFNDEMPYLEMVMLYMLNDFSGYSVEVNEDNFGLFTSFGDTEKPCYPKPAAISVYKFMHKTEDVTPLYKYCPELMP